MKVRFYNMIADRYCGLGFEFGSNEDVTVLCVMLGVVSVNFIWRRHEV